MLNPFTPHIPLARLALSLTLTHRAQAAASNSLAVAAILIIMVVIKQGLHRMALMGRRISLIQVAVVVRPVAAAQARRVSQERTD
jgi:hypothetical protein